MCSSLLLEGIVALVSFEPHTAETIRDRINSAFVSIEARGARVTEVTMSNRYIETLMCDGSTLVGDDVDHLTLWGAVVKPASPGGSMSVLCEREK